MGAFSEQRKELLEKRNNGKQWSTVPISVFLDKDDPLLETKLKFTKNHKSKTFTAVATLEDQIMIDFISWIRIAVFSGSEQQFLEGMEKSAENPNEWDDDELSEWAKNTNPWGLENEIKVWDKIDEIVTDQLSIYDSTYEEDLMLLEKDQKEKCLSGMKRNYLE